MPDCARVTLLLSIPVTGVKKPQGALPWRSPVMNVTPGLRAPWDPEAAKPKFREIPLWSISLCPTPLPPQRAPALAKSEPEDFKIFVGPLSSPRTAKASAPPSMSKGPHPTRYRAPWSVRLAAFISGAHRLCTKSGSTSSNGEGNTTAV
jgi:hypothetical protein